MASEPLEQEKSEAESEAEASLEDKQEIVFEEKQALKSENEHTEKENPKENDIHEDRADEAEMEVEVKEKDLGNGEDEEKEDGGQKREKISGNDEQELRKVDSGSEDVTEPLSIEKGDAAELKDNPNVSKTETSQEKDDSEDKADEDKAEVEVKESDIDSAEDKDRKDDSDVIEEKERATPNNERPTRKRKMVVRYSVPSVARSPVSKSLLIDKGRGTQLKDIPNVAFKLSKRKPDDTLQSLHMILFGKKAKAYSLKRNIGQFSGYIWLENEQEKQKGKVREKLDKCIKEKLLDFCDVLNIPINKANIRKEEISAKILEFLESPHSTTEILLADVQKAKTRKRKVTPSKSVSPGAKSTDAPTKKQKHSPLVKNKQKDSKDLHEEGESSEKFESPETKYDSDEDSDNDMVPRDESEQVEEGNKPTNQVSSKKGLSKKKPKSYATNRTATPGPVNEVNTAKKEKIKRSTGSTLRKCITDTVGTATTNSKLKGSVSKKQNVEEDGKNDESISLKKQVSVKKQSSQSPAKISMNNKGKGKSSKKAKTEPTREELHAAVVDILKEVDFNETTLSDIFRQLGACFEVDLMHRKVEVKEIIMDIIKNMSDEEEEEEEGEEASDNAESGDEEGKSGEDVD